MKTRGSPSLLMGIRPADGGVQTKAAQRLGGWSILKTTDEAAWETLNWQLRLFAKSLQWMAPEVEARWKLGHMTASRKAR